MVPYEELALDEKTQKRLLKRRRKKTWSCPELVQIYFKIIIINNFLAFFCSYF